MEGSITRNRFGATLVVALAALLLSGCVGENNHGAVQPSRQVSSETAAAQAQPALQPELFTVSADLLFVPPGFDISPKGRAVLNDIAAKLRMLKNSKIVVYGYTDSEKIGAEMKKRGIQTNIDLSSRRAEAVVNYLVAQRVSSTLLSAKGRGDTHPAAANATAQGRAQNRRVEIAVEGPGS